MVRLELEGQGTLWSHHFRVVHVVGVVGGNREVAVGGHLLARVHDRGAGDGGDALDRLVVVVPEAAEPVALLVAEHRVALLEAALDGRQAADAGADNADVLSQGHVSAIKNTCCFISKVDKCKRVFMKSQFSRIIVIQAY